MAPWGGNMWEMGPRKIDHTVAWPPNAMDQHNGPLCTNAWQNLKLTESRKKPSNAFDESIDILNVGNPFFLTSKING